MKIPTWDVVATIKAPQSMVARFVAKYRALGARRIWIYYDSPDFAFTLLGDDLEQIVCDRSYWTEGRPFVVEVRQSLNATRSLSLTKADWLLHCDVDEHLFCAGTVAEELAQVPATALGAKLAPVEAIYLEAPQSEEEVFSTPYFKTLAAPLRLRRTFWGDQYGTLADLTNAGFWAHTMGKTFTRVASKDEIERVPIHDYGQFGVEAARSVDLSGVCLCHYDCLSLDQWMQKHLDRAEGKVVATRLGAKRQRIAEMIQQVNDSEGTQGARRLHSNMFALASDRMREALELGVVIDLGAP